MKAIGWLVCFVVLALVAAVGIVVNVNRLRFERRVADEMRALVAAPASRMPRPAAASLPPPVARYRQIAVGDRAPVRTLRMRHGGTFCMRPSATPVPIRGTQSFSADPPGFVWAARIRMGPGIWIDVHWLIEAMDYDEAVERQDQRGVR